MKRARRREREAAEPLALAVAEDVCEKHVGVLAVRFEQDDIGRGVLSSVFFHAGSHARMDDCAKRLRQHEREPFEDVWTR